MRRRTAVPCLVALSSAIVFASPGPPARAACEQPPCRAYLPLAGGRLRLDIGEYGSEGPSWQPLGMHDRVLDLAYDAEGDLWAATLGGLTEWPAAGGEPRVHSHAPISQVAVDGAGAVWFGGFQAAGGVERVEADPLERLLPDGRRQRFTVADGLPAGWLQALAVDDRGRLLASWGPLGEDGPGGLARWEEAAGWRVWEAEDFTAGGGPWAMAPDGAGGMWLAGGGEAAEEDLFGASWLRRVAADGRLQPLEPFPGDQGDRFIFRLAKGAGSKLYALSSAAGTAKQTQAGPDAGPEPLVDSRLEARSAGGDWTTIDLPLEEVDAAREQPQGFEIGPRDLAVDAASTLWLQFDGVLMAQRGDGSYSLFPAANGAPISDKVDRGVLDLLARQPALAPRPLGGLALGARSARGVALVDAGLSGARSWRGSSWALPGRVSHLTPGAGGLFAIGDDQGQGRIWFDAQNGAGFAAIDGRSLLAPDEAVFGRGLSAIAIAPNGDYWIGDGEQVIRCGRDRRRIEVIGPGQGLPGGAVLSIAVGSDGVVWVGTVRGIARRDGNGTWSRPSLPPSLGHVAMDLAPSPDGGVWAALESGQKTGSSRQGGLVRVEGAGRVRAWSVAQLFDLGEGVDIPIGQDLVAVAPDGRVYSSGPFGVVSGDGRSSWDPEPFNANGALAIDRRGKLWTYDWAGDLIRYDPTTSDIDGFALPISSNSKSVSDLFVNPRNGDLWTVVTSFDRAATTSVFLRRNDRGAWDRIDISAVLPGQLIGERFWGLAVGVDGTLAAVSDADRLVVYGQSGIGMWEPQDRLPEGGSLAGPGCVDPVGRYWLPYREGLSGYRPGEGWRHLRSADGLPPRPDAARVFCAPDGAVWLTGGGQPSIERWSPAGRLEPMEQALGIQPGEGALHVAWSPDGRAAVLVTAEGLDSEPAEGLLVGQPGGGFRRHAPSVLAGALATDLAWGPDGRLWVATDRGLALLDARSAGAQPAWVADGAVAGRGLLDLAWRGGRLWAVGFGGAAERLADGRWRPFTKADGLPSDRLRQAAEGPDGALWLVDQPGVVVRLAR